MISLVFPADRLQWLQQQLAHPDLESAAVLLASPMRLRNGGWRLLVKDLHVASEGSYTHRSATSVQIAPDFCLPLEQQARQGSLSLVYVHTHPGATEAEFSAVDNASESAIGKYLRLRCPSVPHVSLLFGRDKIRARVLGEPAMPVRVLEVGASRNIRFDTASDSPMGEVFDRQVRAFGTDGQRQLAQLCVGIVGLGGTGSLVAQQLAHLGVRRFVLCDDDVVEPTNLNRVVGTNSNDVGVPKIETARRLIQQISSDAEVTLILANVTAAGVARQVVEADMVFNCTDTHSSRHVLNQAAYQFLTPVLDMGVSIHVDEQARATFAGHVKLLAPQEPCLWCLRHLDAERVRRELMTDEQREADQYVQGSARVVQPAVISLNGVVASVAVTMLLSVVAGVPAEPRYVLYQGNRARMNAASASSDPACPFCGPTAPIGWGDLVPLPERTS